MVFRGNVEPQRILIDYLPLSYESVADGWWWRALYLNTEVAQLMWRPLSSAGGRYWVVSDRAGESRHVTLQEAERRIGDMVLQRARALRHWIDTGVETEEMM